MHINVGPSDTEPRLRSFGEYAPQRLLHACEQAGEEPPVPVPQVPAKYACWAELHDTDAESEEAEEDTSPPLCLWPDTDDETPSVSPRAGLPPYFVPHMAYMELRSERDGEVFGTTLATVMAAVKPQAAQDSEGSTAPAEATTASAEASPANAQPCGLGSGSPAATGAPSADSKLAGGRPCGRRRNTVPLPIGASSSWRGNWRNNVSVIMQARATKELPVVLGSSLNRPEMPYPAATKIRGQTEPATPATPIMPAAGLKAPGAVLAPTASPDIDASQGHTTLMIRNLPRAVTNQRLVEELRCSDWGGQFDFCYLPCDFRSTEGKGFAFVNLVSPAAANALTKAWHLTWRFGTGLSEPPLNISIAAIQGKEANVQRWKELHRREVRNPQLRPFIADL